MTRTRFAGATRALATLLAVSAGATGCEALGDPELDPIAKLESALIAPVGTSDAQTIRTWNWNGTASDITVSDGNMTNPTGKYTITWMVTPSPITTQRKLSITRDESNGKLTVVARTEVLIAGGPNMISSQSTLTFNPHGATTMTRWSQGQSTVTCPVGELGQWVVNDSACYEPLFDQRVLSRLPMAKFYNGQAPTHWLVAFAIAGAYQKVYADHLLLWDTLRYRANLAAPTLDRNNAYTVIKAFLDETGYALHHGDINHGPPLADGNEDWTDLGHHAGFLDGHRAYMFLFEEWITQPNNVGFVVPFRRLPAWIPTTVPSEFDRDSLPDVTGRDVNRTTGGPGVRTQDRPTTICTTYATSSKARLQAMNDGGTNINGWHGSVHGSFGGGHFSSFSVTANTPLFWVWHTTVDSVWANLQRCYLDDGDSL